MAEKPDPHPLRSLVLFLGSGAAIFVLGLFLVLWFLGAAGGFSYDPSVLDFYPVMAGLGAVFGFERWWAHMYGPSNPFHDK
ncbi:MAG: hypothetical protein KGI26_03630 [Thaumarchaeota archaeon]|nr:hypothetical protein [Nitrososphaerota archaeon]